MPTPSKPVLFLAAVASVVASLVLLALIEFVAGFFVEPLLKRELPQDAVSQTMTWLDINPTPQIRDPELLWRNKPGASKTQPVNPRPFGRDDQWTIKLDSRGFRGDETPQSSERVYRILCVGDSITFGFNVDQPDAYPAQLREILADRFGRARFEVINAGTPGWSWVQGLRFLDRHGFDLDPDLVVIGHGSNDQFFPSRITDEELLLELSTPFERLRQWIGAYASATNIYRAIQRTRPVEEEAPVSRGCREQIAQTKQCRRVSLGQIAASVEQVSKLARQKGVEVLVLNTDFVETAAIHGIRKGVESAGVPFIDLVDEFRRRRVEDENRRADKLGLARASEIGPASEPGAQKRALVRVLVPDPASSYRVQGGGIYRPQFVFDKTLVDDASGGDEKAGDGVFSASIDVPAEIPAIAYRFLKGDIIEFTPLPPLASTQGDRVQAMPSDQLGPVLEFGKAFMMAERTHPNRDGQRLIAELVTQQIEKLPAFREHLVAAGETR